MTLSIPDENPSAAQAFLGGSYVCSAEYICFEISILLIGYYPQVKLAFIRIVRWAFVPAKAKPFPITRLD